MNLLVSGVWSTAKDNIPELERMGHTVQFIQQEKEALPCNYEWVEGVICNGLFLWHPIERFVNLKYIQLTSAGFDRVPMDYVEASGIEIHNAKGVYSIPMAEFAVSGVLQIYKQSRFFYEKQKAHRWEKHRGLLELYGKTVCIVGCGSVGTECAKRFLAFDCEVIGVDLYPREDKHYRKMVHLNYLDDLLPTTDILILTLPLTADTLHLMNTERFQLLKNGAVLVNIARGAVIDTEALIGSFDKLGGAVLDVFEKEPLDGDSPLWQMENVIVMPHNSFVGEKNQERLTDVLLSNLKVCQE